MSAAGSIMSVTKDLPAVMYADFIEEGGVADLDTFLTKVQLMPAANQNKMLREKLMLINEKMANMYEEFNSVQDFNMKTKEFFGELRQTVVMGNDRFGEDVLVDAAFRAKVDLHTQKAIRHMENFEIFFK